LLDSLLQESLKMGVHLNETELADLEPQIFKIFKKELGFFDADILSSTMATINRGVERSGLEDHLKDMLDTKKAAKLCDEVWGIVEEYYLLKQEQSGEGASLGKRRHDQEEEEYISEHKKKRFIDLDSGRDRYDKAERYKQEELERVQRIPKKETSVKEEGAEAAVEAPSADKIRQMLANTQKAIEDRKKKLNLVTPLHQPTVLSGKVQQLAALQASIASKLSQVNIPKVNLPDKPVALIIDESGRTVDSSGKAIQLTAHIPTLRANQLAMVKKMESTMPAKEEIKKPKPEKQDNTYLDPRVGQRPAARTKRVMVFHDAGKFQDEANRLRMKAQLEKLQSDISSIARKTGISSATQLAKLVPKGDKDEKEPDIEWWDQLLIGSTNYENWVVRPGAISNLIEHPIQLRPMESSRPVHVPMFLTKKEHKKLRRQNRREAWKEKQDKIRLGLVAPDEPKVKMSNLMRVLGNEQILDPTKVEGQVRAQMAKRKTDHETANAERKLTPAQKKEKNARKLKEDTSAGIHVAVYRVKDLRNPAKKWKLEKNAQQLFLTGTVLLYQDVNIVVVEGGPKQQKKYQQLMLRRIKWSEEKYLDKDGTEHDNLAELVWEGQTKQRNFGDMKFKLCPTEGFAREHFKKAGCEHYWDHAYSTAVLANSEDL